MILALDFDGVIVDSVRDAFVTAYNAYVKIFPDTKLLGGKQITPEDIFEGTIFKNKIYLEYEIYRCFTNTGGQQVAAIRAIDKNLNITKEEKFVDYLNEMGDKKLKKYDDEFYLERKKIFEKDNNAWYSLTPAFEVIETLKKINKKNIYIVSSKNKEAISNTLKHNNVDFPEEKILDKYYEIDKLKKLRKIAKDLKIKEEEINFVDDMLLHIAPVRNNSKIKCHLSTWGYNNEDQRKKSKQLGINLLTQKDFIKLLEKLK